MDDEIEERISEARSILSQLKNTASYTSNYQSLLKGWQAKEIIHLLSALGLEHEFCIDGSGDLVIKGGGRICFFRDCPECGKAGLENELKPTVIIGRHPKDKIDFICPQCNRVFTFKQGQLKEKVL